MQTILSLLFALTLGTAFGQFIPQPMGYNPDANGDEFIGVDDVMGTLALYNNAFDNGDSIVVTSLTFPDDYGDEYGGQPSIYLDEETDFVYLHQTESQGVRFYLPQGSGFKVMQLFFSYDNEQGGAWYPSVYQAEDSDSDIYGSELLISQATPTHLILIRGHNGKWYSPYQW